MPDREPRSEATPQVTAPGRWRVPGKTERRLTLVVVLTALAPLAAALFLATSLFRQASALWFNPEVGQQLDRGVELYKDYVKAVKDDLRHQTMAIAAGGVLREAARKRNVELIESELDAILPHDKSARPYPELVSIRVRAADGTVLGARDRGHAVDAASERSLEVQKALGDDLDVDAPVVVATFAVARKRLDELEAAGSVVHRYHQLEASRAELYQGYLNAFAALLGVTMIVTVVLGVILARGVTRRINRLGAAINVVAQGDLSVRVPVTGSDELTDLARTFNRMLGEMAQSRARIEFLQRMGAWQEMAQRLAHEIKNPLTPIQLAVQECHRKYPGDEPKYRALLDTTLEIVEEEVGTLRRLVGNFSNFARLPHAELTDSGLGEFLEDCKATLGHLEDASLGSESADAEPVVAQNVEIDWEMPPSSVRVAIDRQMLRRVLVNLVRNAVQAIRDAGAEAHGRVVVRGEEDHETAGAKIVVEDDGPGIDEALEARIFEPYFTTKSDGTGLGLAIVKKIIVEHGGEIEVTRSTRLGGARFEVRLPSAARVPTAAESAREIARRHGVTTRGHG
ncbi:MAG: HAMP domain-containing protein [Myxococcales bacterium]|nr:HAMP domain-containing protein [Myxococcales bacterium]